MVNPDPMEQIRDIAEQVRGRINPTDVYIVIVGHRAGGLHVSTNGDSKEVALLLSLAREERRSKGAD